MKESESHIVILREYIWEEFVRVCYQYDVFGLHFSPYDDHPRFYQGYSVRFGGKSEDGIDFSKCKSIEFFNGCAGSCSIKKEYNPIVRLTPFGFIYETPDHDAEKTDFCDEMGFPIYDSIPNGKMKTEMLSLYRAVCPIDEEKAEEFIYKTFLTLCKNELDNEQLERIIELIKDYKS